MKKLLFAFLVLVVSLCFLGSCNKKQAADGDGGKITLEVFHMFTPEDMQNNIHGRAWYAMTEKFKAANPDVVFNETSLEQTDFHTKMMALSAADELPDLFQTKGSWVHTFYQNNLLADLAPFMDQSIWYKGLIDPFIREGKLYAVPYQFLISSVVIYNEKLFKEIAGLDYFPKTWDELVAADKAFKANGITTIAHTDKDKWQYESCILSALGDRFTGTEWTQSIILNDKKAKFTDTDFVTALRYSQELAKMFNPDFIAAENVGPFFKTGKAASFITGDWDTTYVQLDTDPDVLPNIRFAVIPSFPNQKGLQNATSGGAAWGASASSKLTGSKLEKAAEFLKYVSGKEYSQYLMDNDGASGPVPVEPTDRSALSDISLRYRDFTKTVAITPIYDIQMNGAVIDVMNTRLQDLLTGTSSPEEVAAAIQAEQDKVVE